ncbi:H/ACA ribonucleoprotein complex subunit 1 [Strongyloides ratti]|uniref:H/ACA ribonucleoprotein complex subunit n=1 Tax=Strongyloides ratti TaxID=34506 RepID=A0A090LB16_STRRB|nr:H/ACA ribonucleoprotein complex subunit 1 [Strongyloides ratti]CEF65308.1 H/ACA ribonucleoprotein complex subunit 1 [Strongyloides ratti]
MSGRGGFSRGKGNFRGGRGGGGGRGGRNFDQGPPSNVEVVGSVTHSVDENTICVSNTSGKIPYFNAVIYNENIQQLGKVDEIYGGPKDNGFSVILSEGVKAKKFKQGDLVHIDPYKLLPIEKFLPGSQNKSSGGRGGRGGGNNFSRGRGGNRGGNDRGGFRGNNRSGGRGGGRGGSNNDQGFKRRGNFGNNGNSGGYKKFRSS